MLNVLAKHDTKNEYPAEIRKLALELAYMSSKAYKFVRKSFDNHLPQTVHGWQKEYDGSPGLNRSLIPANQSKIKEAAEKSQ